MTNNGLSITQRASLAEKLATRTAATAKPKEAAQSYEAILDQVVPDTEPSPSGQLVRGVKASVDFTNKNWSCASREINNPAIRTAAYEQTLHLLASGPVTSWPSALASVILATLPKLDAAVGKDSAPYIQTQMLKDATDLLKRSGDDSTIAVLQMADAACDKLYLRGREAEVRKDQMRIDALGVIATLDEGPPCSV